MFVALIIVLAALAIGGAIWLSGGSAATGLLAFVVLAAIASGFTYLTWLDVYHNDHWATCTVTGKDRGGEDGTYRVYTKECDTLANEDSFFRGKWNSSNLWQKIEPGHTYRFHIAGYRQPVAVSNFANIYEVELVR